MDGVVSLQQGGCMITLHDKRIDHCSVCASGTGLATATLRGNVTHWSERMFQDRAEEAGLMRDADRESTLLGSTANNQRGSYGDYGDPVFQVQKGSVRVARAA
jgi:hypothetical protein